MTTKRFMKLQIIIILMFTFTLICNTFSWATRPAVSGGAFMGGNNTDGYSTFEKDATYFTAIKLITPERGYHINGNECTAVTYRAEIDAETGEVEYDRRGNIVYDETTPVTFEGGSIETTLTPSTKLHFKTVITNLSDVATNTSIFIDAKYHENINTSVLIGISTPITRVGGLLTDEYQYVDPTAPVKEVLFTPKWAPVITGLEIGPESTRNVEWYIFNNSGIDEGSFSLDNIYFTNN